MKTITAILLIALAACSENDNDPTFCYECTTITTTTVNGVKEISTKTDEHCSITQDQADGMGNTGNEGIKTTCTRKY